MVHDYPYYEGGESDDSSRLLAYFTDGLDHVGDMFNPPVDFSICRNGVDSF